MQAANGTIIEAPPVAGANAIHTTPPHISDNCSCNTNLREINDKCRCNNAYYHYKKNQPVIFIE